MTPKPVLKLDWAPYEAARHAVTNWHYSRSMPAVKTVKIGAWEDGAFIGVVIFSWGANPHLGAPYGLPQVEICELTRVALRDHRTPVSRILAIAIKMLRKQSPGLRLIVSYADCDQNHHGGIYAAGGWIYEGKTQLDGGTPRWRILGKVMHGRSVGSRGWKQNADWLRKHVDPKAEAIYTTGKHKYLFPLDPELAKKVEKLRKPYPKRAGSIESDAAAFHAEKGGASPTPAFQFSNKEAQTNASAGGMARS